MTGEVGTGQSPQLWGLAANPALPTDLLDRLIAVADADLCEDLAQREDLSHPQALRLSARGGSATTAALIDRGLLAAADVDTADPDVGLALITGRGSDPLARDLRRHPDRSVRAGLAASPVPPDVLTALAWEPETEVVEAVASADGLTDALADQLARHDHLSVRCALAGNARTPPSVLTDLAADGMHSALWCYRCDGTPYPPPGECCDGDHASAKERLLSALAANPATPPTVAAALVDHPSSYVRRTLADRPDLSQDEYRRLSLDPVPFVRSGVAENPAIDEGLMRAMAADATYGVSRSLAHNPVIPLDLLAGIVPHTRIGPTLLPRVARATPDEIDAMARSPIATVRMLLAERPDLPAAVVDRLAADPDAKVLKSIAPNPQVTEAQLRTMLDRHGVRVAAAIARNPNCGATLLHDLARHVPRVQKVFRRIASHPNVTAATLVLCLGDSQAAPIAAGHLALAPVIIGELVHDDRPLVAEAAAANPALPRIEMERLIATAEAGPRPSN